MIRDAAKKLYKIIKISICATGEVVQIRCIIEIYMSAYSQSSKNGITVALVFF